MPNCGQPFKAGELHEPIEYIRDPSRKTCDHNELFSKKKDKWHYDQAD
jgi:hypothetical protein